jgi:two-component system, chemotaxis family, response regulator Rcp1
MKIRVLMVEDNPGDARLAREALACGELQPELTIADDGHQALDMLRRDGARRPDLILLDLHMPQLSGAELLSEIKSDENLKRIPVVVFSSSDAQEDVRDSYYRGANCYVRKPSTFDGFRNTLRSLQGFWFGLAQLPQA